MIEQTSFLRGLYDLNTNPYQGERAEWQPVGSPIKINSSEECPICWNELPAEDRLVSLRCSIATDNATPHTFHYSCFEQIRNKETAGCPSCRQLMFPETVQVLMRDTKACIEANEKIIPYLPAARVRPLTQDVQAILASPPKKFAAVVINSLHWMFFSVNQITDISFQIICLPITVAGTIVRGAGMLLVVTIRGLAGDGRDLHERIDDVVEAIINESRWEKLIKSFIAWEIAIAAPLIFILSAETFSPLIAIAVCVYGLFAVQALRITKPHITPNDILQGLPLQRADGICEYRHYDEGYEANAVIIFRTYVGFLRDPVASRERIEEANSAERINILHDAGFKINQRPNNRPYLTVLPDSPMERTLNRDSVRHIVWNFTGNPTPEAPVAPAEEEDAL